MKKYLILLSAAFALFACEGNKTAQSATDSDSTTTAADSVSTDSVATESGDSVAVESSNVAGQIPGAMEAHWAKEKAEMQRIALTVLKSNGYGKAFTNNVTAALRKKVQAGEPIMTLLGFDIMDIALDESSYRVINTDIEKQFVTVRGKAEEPDYEEETTVEYDVTWRVSLVRSENFWLVSAVKLL